MSAAVMSATVVVPRGDVVADVRRLAKASSDAPPAPSAPVPVSDDRPTTPTGPVQIPVKAARHETAHAHAHAAKHRQDWRGPRPGAAPQRRARGGVHSPESISPSVAALLAVTTIPRSRSARSLRRPGPEKLGEKHGEKLGDKRMTVNAIIHRVQEAEQEFSLSLSKSPLDVLLTAPEDLGDDDNDDNDDDVSISDSTLEPDLASTRTVSLESMPSLPSLTDSFATGTLPSYDAPRTPSRRHGSLHKARPTRRSLTPVSSPPGERESDPLSSASVDAASDASADADVDSLDFRVFQPSPVIDPLAKTTEARFPLQPLRSAFKSNLTASLRALRNAARSFSSLNLTSIPPEDFLTRSILTIDPRIPYTDERRPPPLEEEPSAALRRYLNPATGPQHMDPRHTPAAQMLSPALASASLSPLAPASLPSSPAFPGPSSSSSSGGGATSPGSSPPRSPFTASIQMQTYRVHRGKGASSRPSFGTSSSGGSRGRNSSSSSGQASYSASQPPGRPRAPLLEPGPPPPGPRQRELRENSDFIRVAVMEMAMRRAGKLDDRKPGRARLALPPRKMPGKPYVIRTDGVPARWVSIASSDS